MGGGGGDGGGGAAASDESAPLGIIPNLADDLYDQRVTQGGASFEFQTPPLHRMEAMSAASAWCQSAFLPPPHDTYCSVFA